MSRFYVRPEDVKGDEIIVSKEEAHHIVDVMRLGTGDKVVAFDGTGKEYIGALLNSDAENLRIKIEKVRKFKDEDKVHVTLAQAIPKGGKIDLLVEKATELGVDEIIPLVTQRTLVRLDANRRDKKHQHWQNIAISASKQCGRVEIPKVRAPLMFKDILTEAHAYDLRMIACLSDATIPLNKAISSFRGSRILVMVGPEGDFTPQEIKEAQEHDFKLISLGRLILRSETAGIFILAAINYENSSV